MNQQLRERTDADGLRATLYLSVCDAIWHFRLSKLPKDHKQFFGANVEEAPDDRSNLLYPISSTQLLETIESLLRLPFDLLSVKMSINVAARKNKDLFRGLPSNTSSSSSSLIAKSISIMDWALELGATEVAHIILDIDPTQVVHSEHDHCEPLHRSLSSYQSGNAEAQLHLTQRIHHFIPDAITTTERITEDLHSRKEIKDLPRDLPLHIALRQCQPLEVIRFLVDKYPEATMIQGNDDKLPMNCISLDKDCNINNLKEQNRFLIEKYPEGLGNRFEESRNCALFSGFHMHRWFYLNSKNVSIINSLMKMTYELGKKHNIFGKDTVYGLFEMVSFTAAGSNSIAQLTEANVDDDEYYLDLFWEEYFNMWKDLFQWGYYSANRRAERTTLEYFLYRYRELHQPNYIHGWDDAFDVFHEAMDTSILQPAIGRVQDDFLPHIIDKFGVDLTQIDDHGRTPLIVSMYHAAFASVKTNLGDNESRDNYDDREDDSVMHESKKRKPSPDEPLLVDASMILSTGKLLYERRSSNQSLEIDIISMMLGIKSNDSSIHMDIDDQNNDTDLLVDVVRNPTNMNPAMVKDGNGRLPLHIGAEIGLEWNNGLKTVLDAYSLAVEQVDPMSGLYAFMLAAVGEESYDLNAIFGLFVKQPDVIEKV